MSGRLVILPKKSYCPWNAKNVERCLRDERLERERQTQLDQQQQTQESQSRWNALKQKKNDKTPPPQQQQPSLRNNHKEKDNDPTKHVNLFEQEEQACLLEQGPARKAAPKQKAVGILPVFLGASLSKEREQKAVQMAKEQDQDYCIKEERRKSRMDPMQPFSSSVYPPPPVTQEASTIAICKDHPARADNGSYSESSEKSTSFKNDTQKRKHKRKQHRGESKRLSKEGTEDRTREERRRTEKTRKRQRREEDSDTISSSSSSSSSEDSYRQKRRRRRRRRKQEQRRMEKHRRVGEGMKDGSSVVVDIAELRRRRLEREAREQEREAAAIRDAASEREGRPGMTGRHYHNQYYPNLSRK